MNAGTADAAQRARQKQRRTIFTLAGLLIIGGFVVLLFLKRMPLPLRMLVGATDVVAGVVLLVVGRQMAGRVNAPH